MSFVVVIAPNGVLNQRPQIIDAYNPVVWCDDEIDHLMNRCQVTPSAYDLPRRFIACLVRIARVSRHPEIEQTLCRRLNLGIGGSGGSGHSTVTATRSNRAVVRAHVNHPERRLRVLVACRASREVDHP